MERNGKEHTLIILEELEGNPPAELNKVQHVIEPYSDAIGVVWWLLWFFVLMFVVVKYLLVPLIRKRKKS